MKEVLVLLAASLISISGISRDLMILDDLTMNEGAIHSDKRIFWADFHQVSTGLFFEDTAECELYKVIYEDDFLVNTSLEVILFKYVSSKNSTTFCYEGWIRIVKNGEVLYYDQVYAKENCFYDGIDVKSAIFANRVLAKVSNGKTEYFDLMNTTFDNYPRRLTDYEFSLCDSMDLLGKRKFKREIKPELAKNATNMLTIQELFFLEPLPGIIDSEFYFSKLLIRRDGVLESRGFSEKERTLRKIKMHRKIYKRVVYNL